MAIKEPVVDASKTVDIGEKLAPLDVVFGGSELSQPAVIAAEGSVLAGSVRGGFRLLHRLFVQIERILKINDLSLVTDDVVEAARSTLVIGVI
ncbi:hypothetical protein [Roseobacter sp. CCS2]|uniref:hypothetical protein n=1 Tax=Roseobacter sp. CCS2 TaxID=391593 RepID=UPI0000F40057|nr:hypothetical protein [Roseobacter sp. CCS2]EBA13652.1 ATP-binding protein [Roseobacter sp. CCS2]